MKAYLDGRERAVIETERFIETVEFQRVTTTRDGHLMLVRREYAAARETIDVAAGEPWARLRQVLQGPE